MIINSKYDVVYEEDFQYYRPDHLRQQQNTYPHFVPVNSVPLGSTYISANGGDPSE